MIKFPSNLKECERFSCSECDAKGFPLCWYPGKRNDSIGVTKEVILK